MNGLYYVIHGRRSLYLLVLLLIIGTTFWYSFHSNSEHAATMGVEAEEPEVVQVLAGGIQRTVSELEQNVVVTVAPVPTKFAEYRIEREKVRSRQIDLLDGMLAENQISIEQRDQLQRELITLVENIAKETELENLLKANGYLDAVVLLESNSATVVVPVTLSQSEAANIGQLVQRITNVALERITIVDELSSTT